MPKSATDVMQEIVFSAVIDSVVALKSASKGVPNVLLRDLNAVHPNVTLADLPDDVRAAITASVRDAFSRLRKEGYAVAPADSAPRPRPQPPRPPSGDARRPRPPRNNAAGDGPARPRPRTGKGPPRPR